MTWVWVENEDWLPDLSADLEGWEPWSFDPEDMVREGGCEYCEREAVRTEPFGLRRCCDPCFNVLIGGNEDDEPWRCGTLPMRFTFAADRTEATS